MFQKYSPSHTFHYESYCIWPSIATKSSPKRLWKIFECKNFQAFVSAGGPLIEDAVLCIPHHIKFKIYLLLILFSSVVLPKGFKFWFKIWSEFFFLIFWSQWKAFIIFFSYTKLVQAVRMVNQTVRNISSTSRTGQAWSQYSKLKD